MRRKRPRLFSFSREIELSHYDEVIVDPEDRRLLEAIIDGFIEVSRTHAVTADLLRPFARGARHPRLQIRGLAVTRLSVLSHYFDQAAAVMSEVCGDPDPEVRLFACAMVANAPPEVGMPLLRRALDDPSWEVRKAAAQAAGAVVWPGLADLIRRHHEREADARVRVVLALALQFQESRAVR